MAANLRRAAPCTERVGPSPHRGDPSLLHKLGWQRLDSRWDPGRARPGQQRDTPRPACPQRTRPAGLGAEEGGEPAPGAARPACRLLPSPQTRNGVQDALSPQGPAQPGGHAAAVLLAQKPQCPSLVFQCPHGLVAHGLTSPRPSAHRGPASPPAASSPCPRRCVPRPIPRGLSADVTTERWAPQVDEAALPGPATTRACAPRRGGPGPAPPLRRGHLPEQNEQEASGISLGPTAILRAGLTPSPLLQPRPRLGLGDPGSVAVPGGLAAAQTNCPNLGASQQQGRGSQIRGQT